MKLTEILDIPKGCQEDCVQMSALITRSNELDERAQRMGDAAMDESIVKRIVDDMTLVDVAQGGMPTTVANYRRKVAADLNEIDEQQDMIVDAAQTLLDGCRAKCPLEVRASQYGRGVMIVICNSAALAEGTHIEPVPVVRYPTDYPA